MITKIARITLLIAFAFAANQLLAQVPPPPPSGHGSGGNQPANGGGAPIGGGLGIMLALGAAWGGKKLYVLKKQK